VKQRPQEYNSVRERQRINPTNLAVCMSIAVLIVGVSCSLLATHWLRMGIQTHDEDHFNHLVTQLKPRIDSRFNSCRIGLYGLQGLYTASKSVERDEFRRYVKTLAVEEHLKGAFGFGFIQRVPRDKLGGFVAAERADGAPDFDVRTTGNLPELHVIKLIEPLDRNPDMLGLDVAPMSACSEATQRAMRTGAPVLSEGLGLLPSDPCQQPVYFYLMAVYRNGSETKTAQLRRAALVGWVFTPLRFSEVLAGIADGSAGEVRLQVLDASNRGRPMLVYDSASDEADPGYANREARRNIRASRFSSQTVLTLGGRDWTVRMASTPYFEHEHESPVPVMAGTCGVIISALFAVLLWSIGESRARALTLVEQLRASGGQLRTTLSTLTAYRAALDQQVIITMTDTAGTITEVNDLFCSTSGYSRDELVGRDHRIVSSGYHSEAFFAEMWDTITKGEVWRGEVCNRRKDGRPLWLGTTIGPVRDETGEICGYVAVRVDVTERKRVELELRKAHQELEDRVAARTAELETAKDAAEVAAAAKSDFLATMSHELRTPLNGVIGMMELLLDSKLTDRQQRYAMLAKSSGDTLLSLINDILDFSKIEAGKLELETTDFDLRHIVESLGSSMASRAEAKGLELICSVHPEVPVLVRGDPGRLQQILLNLMSNAVKFTETGHVVVRATSDASDDRQATVRFTVSDTGIGIATDRLDRLFRSFSQVDSSTTRKYGGSGLGLAISKRLVELMGGTIGVESELDRGSTFWFKVGFERQTVSAAEPKPLSGNLRDVRILAVDDDATNREIIVEQLSSLGFDNDTASSGEDALAKLRDAAARLVPFNLAIIDMQMPAMNGEQLAQAIKHDRALEHTVLLLLSSGGGPYDEGRLGSIGFSGWHPKPVRQSQLLDSIVEALACAGIRSNRDNLAPSGETSSWKHRSKTVGAKILLAEDNEVNKEAAMELLTQAGYRCSAVANGREAVTAVVEGDYDLVLMDCQMPEMDGFDATREIRRREQRPDRSVGGNGRIPIIALTANALKGDRERCLEAGMDDYLSKPIDPEKLVEVVESHLSPEDEGVDVCEPEDPRVTLDAGAGGASPNMEDTSSPFDFDALHKRWGQNKDLAEKLLAKFCEDAPMNLERLDGAVAAGDAEEATRLAHGLKGAASYVAADRFRKYAAQLEEMGNAGELSHAEACLSALHSEMDRCLEAGGLIRAATEKQHAHTDR